MSGVSASKEVTTKQIKSISFGFYTDDEVNLVLNVINSLWLLPGLKSSCPHVRSHAHCSFKSPCSTVQGLPPPPTMFVFVPVSL